MRRRRIKSGLRSRPMRWRTSMPRRQRGATSPHALSPSSKPDWMAQWLRWLRLLACWRSGRGRESFGASWRRHPNRGARGHAERGSLRLSKGAEVTVARGAQAVTAGFGMLPWSTGSVPSACARRGNCRCRTVSWLASRISTFCCQSSMGIGRAMISGLRRPFKRPWWSSAPTAGPMRNPGLSWLGLCAKVIALIPLLRQ